MNHPRSNSRSSAVDPQLPTPAHPARTLWLLGVLHAFTHIYHVALALLIVVSLAGLPCLHAIRKRESALAETLPVHADLA
jgi:hypothetical protein